MNLLFRSWRSLFQDRTFFLRLIPLAGPVILQSLISQGMQFLTNIFVGRLGETAISAVTLGNMVLFFLMLTGFGINSGASVFGSQYFGAGDIKGVKRTQGLSLSLSLVTGFVFTLAVWLTQDLWLKYLSSDSEVIRHSKGYLQILAGAFPLHMICVNFTLILRSCGDTKIPLKVSFYTLVLFVITAFPLIYGSPWFPGMGIQGAAWAFLASKALEAFLLILFTYIQKRPNAGNWHELFDFPKGFLKQYFKVTFPVVLNEMLWAILMMAVRTVYSLMGRDHLTAYSIADTFFQLSFIIFFGTGSAAGILIGNAVGKNHFDDAKVLALRFATLAPLLGGVMGIVFVALSPILPLIFEVSTQVRSWAGQMILILGFFLPVKAFYHDALVGIFRGGGDTRYAAIVDIIGACAAVAAAFTGAFLLGLPIPLVYLFVLAQDIAVCLMLLHRLRTGRWINRVIH